jgi:hypothetical protein
MDIQALLVRYNKAKADHDSLWLPNWREARDYSYPSMNDTILPGQKVGDKLFDTTAIEANERYASGVYSWCCPPDKRWFEVQPQIEELKKLDPVRWYYAEVNRIIYDAINNSNWSMMFHESALNMGSIGTAVLYMEEGDSTLLNFLGLSIEKVCILEDKEQRVDTVFREFEYTARQCLQEFGEEGCSDEMLSACKDMKNMEKKFKILHAVCPRKDCCPGKFDAKSMPVASFYIDLQTKKVLQESGYWEMPYITPRTSKKEDEPYGRGNAMNCIQEIKMLNRFQKADIYGTEKAFDPPVLIPDNCLVDNTFKTRPGGVNFYRPGAGGFKPEPFFDGANLPQLEKRIEVATLKVRNRFYNDMFDALGDRRNMSASEIIERSESKLIPFAPVLGRLQAEMFTPLITRAYGILYRRGALPPVPPVLQQYPGYRIEFVSRISIAIKQLEAKGLMQTFESLMPLVSIRPDIMDHFDTDAITRGLARNNGVPQEWILPQEKVEALRKGRQQAQEQQMAVAQMIEGAKALPGVSKTIEPNSALGQMAQAGG